MPRKPLMKRAKREKKEVDRLSQLPIPLAAQILSFLPLKDAAATSVLSKCWRRRWLHTHVLDVDALQVFEHPGMTRADQYRQTLYHMKWISYVLQSHRNATRYDELKKLRIRMRLRNYFQDELEEWISYASVCKVQNLELDFTDISSNPRSDCEDLCSFSGKFVAETDLSSLRSLSLAAVNVTGEDISSVLSKCPFLESLKVCRSDVLVRVEICGPSLAMKHLEISYCNHAELIVRDTSLVSLTITWMTKLMLSNNPKLVVVRAAEWDYRSYPLQSLYDSLPRLEAFTFSTSFPDKSKIVLELPLLTKMKQLTLVVDPLHEDSRICAANLLSRAPNLEKLGLEFIYVHKKWKPTKTKEENNSPRFPPVKVVEVRGYYGESQEDETLEYIFKHAEAPPEKIIFDLHDLGREMYAPNTFPQCVAPRVLERSDSERIERLKRVVPSSAEFTVT